MTVRQIPRTSRMNRVADVSKSLQCCPQNPQREHFPDAGKMFDKIHFRMKFFPAIPFPWCRANGHRIQIFTMPVDGQGWFIVLEVRHPCIISRSWDAYSAFRNAFRLLWHANSQFWNGNAVFWHTFRHNWNGMPVFWYALFIRMRNSIQGSTRNWILFAAYVTERKPIAHRQACKGDF